VKPRRHAIRSLWWKNFLRLRGAHVGKNVHIKGPVDVLMRDGASLENLTIGDNCSIEGRLYFRMRANGRIRICDGVKIGTEVWLVAANDSELLIGENTSLGGYSIFNGGHGIRIGASCILAAFVYVSSSDHNYARGELIRNQGYFGAPIDIEDDVWIGGHVFINKGTRIGRGAVIGAGSVVVKHVPEYKVIGGQPTRVLRDR
jgi:acetyltransferase-like isoleucine patch superfamily enzyme